MCASAFYHDVIDGHSPIGLFNYDKLSRSYESEAASNHHMTTIMFHCQYDGVPVKCSIGFTPDVTGHVFQKVPALELDGIFFWQMPDKSLCFFSGQEWLAACSSLLVTILPSVFLSISILYTDLN